VNELPTDPPVDPPTAPGTTDAGGGSSMPPPPPTATPIGLGSTRVRPSAPVPAGGAARVGGLLMLGGGAAIAIAALALPWFSAVGPGGTETTKGIAGSGFGILILSGFAVAKGLQIVAPDRVPFRLGTPIITGVLLLVLLGFRWSDISNGLDRAEAIPGVTASVGSGFWLALAGTVAVLCGGLLLQFGGTNRP
jgi:hypothetical protein